MGYVKHDADGMSLKEVPCTCLQLIAKTLSVARVVVERAFCWDSHYWYKALSLHSLNSASAAFLADVR